MTRQCGFVLVHRWNHRRKDRKNLVEIVPGLLKAKPLSVSIQRYNQLLRYGISEFNIQFYQWF